MRLQALLEQSEEFTFGDFLKSHLQKFGSKRVFSDEKAGQEVIDTGVWKRNSGPFPVIHAEYGFITTHIPRITSLKDGLKEVVGNVQFKLDKNRITSFEGAPEKIEGTVSLTENGITSLLGIHKHFKEIDGELDLRNNDITSGALCLLKIRKLRKVYLDDTKLSKIINEHLPIWGGDILVCQDALIDSGYSKQAKI